MWSGCDWSSDVCSSDLDVGDGGGLAGGEAAGDAGDAEAGYAQCAVDVAVVGQHVAGGVVVFQYGVGIGNQVGRVVHRGHADAQRAAAGATVRVADVVGDHRYAAVPVVDRVEHVVTVGRNGQRADVGDGGGLAGGEAAGDASDAEAGHAQRAVDVAVVAQHVAGGVVVFQHGVGIGYQVGRVVHRGNGDAQRAAAGTAVRVT